MRLIGLAVVLTLSLLLAPLAVEAQEHRIGFLGPRTPSQTERFLEAFRQGLSELGWVEGKNITIEYRFAEGKLERLPDLAAELLHRHKVEIVVAEGGAVRVVQQLSKTIPIVMAEVTAPVEQGFVQSLARPGGNTTGSTFNPVEVAGKRLELLKEIVPKLSRVAVLWHPQILSSALGWKEIQLPARQLRVQLHSLEVASPDDLDRAFKEATRARADALMLLFGDGMYKRTADLAAKSRLPSIGGHRAFAESGALVTYGADVADLFRRAARFVDKILKGAKPADLPVEQPTKFELVINLKTAKALGLTIPQSVLGRADQVIE
jgi:putative tryptophan/tyrosine transport system substrate-binding protein